MPKTVPSPTGRPSKKSPGARKMDRGDFTGGDRKSVYSSPEKSPRQTVIDAIKKRRGLNYRIEDALRRSGA